MATTVDPGSTLEIRLFGGLELLESGRTLKLAIPLKARSILTYLIVHRAERTSRDAIAFLFWPDDDEVRARANLRRHIALIVHGLPAGSEQPILADNRSIGWNPRYPITIDIAEFEELSRDAARLADASRLYRGELLPSVYDEWILPERERLRSMHATNLEVLMERYADAGDYARALATARALLLHDPWREDAMRTLISLRNASGDRAGALQEYEIFVDRLRRDLEVDPMPETVRRYESILYGTDPAKAEHVSSAFERAALAASMPFVGRGDELSRLRQMWVRTMRGSGGVAIVSGEAGIGKTRLVTEFGATVVSQGGTIAAGAATFPEALPYQAILEALRSQLPAILDSTLDPAWRSAAAGVLPDLQDDARLPRLSVLEPERQRTRLFEALWRCFEALARIRPLLLVFEDVHWAGPATVDLLAYLARRTSRHPILIIATCRDDDGNGLFPLRILRQALRAGGTFSTIALGGIAAGDVARVIATVLVGSRATPAFIKRAHELSCGNPFFLAEIVRDSLGAPAALDPALPRSLAATIATRLAALSADAQSIAKLAAVAGNAFTLEILAAAAGTSEGDTVRCIDELLDARLVHATSDEAGSGDAFAFSHDLIRSQIYNGIAETQRRNSHRRIGFVLETLSGDGREALATELARHFDEGREFGRAAAAYLSSARQALRSYADIEALHALSRALAITEEAELLTQALSLRETIYGRAGRRVEQLADLERLEILADAADDEDRRLQCLRRRIQYARAIDDAPGQQSGIALLLARASVTGNRYWHAFASESLAMLMTVLGRYDEAWLRARDAVVAYGEVGDEGGVVRSLCIVADISIWRVDPVSAAAALDEATAIAVATSNEASIVRALATSALAAFMSVDYERARTTAERGLEICRRIGDREGEADFSFRLGNIAGRRFAVVDAARFYASATAIYETLTKPLGQAIVLLNSAVLCLKIGGHSEALDALKRARAIFLDVNDLRGVTICSLDLGMAAHLRGRFGAALRLSTHALSLARRLGSPQLECSALGNVGAAERELGEHDASVAHSELALDQRRRMAPMDIGSDLADMGLTYMRAGDMPRACAIANEIETLSATALESVMFPQNVLWSAAQIYEAARYDDAYERTLLRAVDAYRERSAKIPDGAARSTYDRLSFNRDMCAAAERRAVPLQRKPADGKALTAKKSDRIRTPR